MKALIILAVLTLSGCSTTNGWDKGTALLEQGPNFTKPGAEVNHASDIPTASGTVITSRGTYVVNRVGNTVSVIGGYRR
jgi:hypothetical protein